ncbi:helix-turn-helix domain-containing protein [Vibrio sp.]|nr:helix-turn-helix domain-containing protein [Vibrio sp.]
MIYQLPKNVTFDTQSGLLRSQESEVQLTQRQNQLLQLLCDNTEYINKESIITHLYGDRYTSNESITKLISLLRSKLAEVDLHDTLETRKNYGYKLIVSAQRVVTNEKRVKTSKSNKKATKIIYILAILLLSFSIAFYGYFKKPITPITPGFVDVKLTKEANLHKDSFCAEITILKLRGFVSNLQFTQDKNIKGVYSIVIDSVNGGTLVTLRNNPTDTIELHKTYPHLFDKNMHQLLFDVLDVIGFSNKRNNEGAISLMNDFLTSYREQSQYYCTAQYDWYQFMTGAVTVDEHGKNAKELLDSFDVDNLKPITILLYMKFAYEAYSFGMIEKDEFESIIYNEPILSSNIISIRAQKALYEHDYNRVVDILSNNTSNLDSYLSLILSNAYLQLGEDKKAKALLYTVSQQLPNAYKENFHKYVDRMFRRDIN